MIKIEDGYFLKLSRWGAKRNASLTEHYLYNDGKYKCIHKSINVEKSSEWIIDKEEEKMFSEEKIQKIRKFLLNELDIINKTYKPRMVCDMGWEIVFIYNGQEKNIKNYKEEYDKLLQQILE